MGGSTKQKTNNKTTLNQWSQDQYNNIAPGILEYANAPVDAYGGTLSQGADPMMTQAAGMAQANVGAGQGAVNSALDAAGNAANYQADQVTAGQLSSTNLDPYMNQYTQGVANNYLDSMDLARQRALVGNSQAAGTGAFNGSRHGVADALTNEASLRETSSGLNSIFSDAFNNAQSAGKFDIGAAMQAASGNQAANYNAAGLNNSAAGVLASIGGQQQQMGQADAGFVNQFGVQQQGLDQAALDRQYADFQLQQQQEMAHQGLALGVLGATPMLTNQKGTTKSTTQPGAAQVIGTAAQIAGMFMSDERRKKNVEPAHTDAAGRQWYRFNYDHEADADEKHVGVMAQQVLKTDPDAVSVDKDGWYQVDYGKLN